MLCNSIVISISEWLGEGRSDGLKRAHGIYRELVYVEEYIITQEYVNQEYLFR